MIKPDDVDEDEWKAFAKAAESQSIHAYENHEEDVKPWFEIWRAAIAYAESRDHTGVKPRGMF